MGVKKLSIALDERVAEAAAASAERHGLSLSAWLNRAAQNALAVVEDLDESRARAAGIVCARSGTRDIADAIVVAGALARADLVVTSDADDLERIASALGVSIRSHRI